MIPIDDYQGTLSVTNLPNIVRFPNNLIAHSLATNNWSFDNNNLPIVVEPIEAENNNLPIVVEPIAAENNQLPIVVEPIEAQSDKSKSQIWFINYGKELQGLLRNEHEPEAPWFTIRAALMNTFTHNKYAIIILDGYMMALIRGVDSVFYVFDSHARNCTGMLDPNGTAVVMSSANVNELEEYLHFLSSELKIYLFEIVPVQFRTCKEQTTTLTSIEKPMSPHLNKNHSNETDKQIRLENARQCMERKRSV